MGMDMGNPCNTMFANAHNLSLLLHSCRARMRILALVARSV